MSKKRLVILLLVTVLLLACAVNVFAGGALCPDCGELGVHVTITCLNDGWDKIVYKCYECGAIYTYYVECTH